MIPRDFQFSQSSLQDFSTCPRRFKLFYLDRLRWPAVEAEPIREAERLARLGQDFHRLVQQHLVGIQAETLSAYLQTNDADLHRWWQNYLRHRPDWLEAAELYPELTLSTPLLGYRLLARFDLLAVRPDGGFVIIDWKTSQRKARLADPGQRIQTRVYRYVMCMAGQAFNGGQPIDPARVRMIYWYAQFPDEPEEFGYSLAHFQEDEQVLTRLLEQIIASDFPLVEDSKPCRQCVYRSYCGRGEKAGDLSEGLLAREVDEPLEAVSLDWEQIAEIQF